MTRKALMQRAYSVLTLKAVDEKKRRFTGIASTPTTDRVGDIVEPKGAVFKLPIPLLWQHDSRDPIGWIDKAKVTADGIEVEGEVAAIPEAGQLQDRLKTAWEYLKNKLVRGLSIGFDPLEYSEIDGTWGLRFLKWEWLELSAVTIPANQDATIISIKSADASLLAASGRKVASRKELIESLNPGVAGSRSSTSTRSSNMTLKEQIAALEAKRKEKAVRMQAIMQKSTDEGRATDAAEAEEFDNLESEVATIDADLKRFKSLESMNVAQATPVAPAAGTNPELAMQARSTPRIEVRSNLPKGTGFTRYAMCLANSKGNLSVAVEMAKRYRDTPEVEAVLKAAVAAGNTTDAEWAGPLVEYQTLASEFIELLRPATIIGRLASLRRVPFNVRMPKQTGGGTYGWVGESKPKPVGKLTFGDVTLRWAKAAGIIVISEELARLSNPSAEAIIRQDMIDGIALFLDQQFITPSVAEVANVSPASITFGITPIAASGVDAAAVRQDVGDMFQTMLAANLTPTAGAWIMSPVTAMRLSLMQNPLGQSEYPNITANGGTWMGYPVITSTAVPAGSDGDLIIFVNQSDIFLSEEGLVIDVSREASLQMNTTPDDPISASTELVSLWQHNLIGLRAERFVNWKRRRDEAVSVIETVAYGTGS